MFQYHVKIKILRQDGLKQADIEIPLYKSKSDQETIKDVFASSYNPDKGRVIETKIESKSIFTEKSGENYNIVKFAIPQRKGRKRYRVSVHDTHAVYFQFQNVGFSDRNSEGCQRVSFHHSR